MTTPPPVLLVLAWDDNDPSVHRVAPAGALPTLPLVRALAARQPVLALLPQLPSTSSEDATDGEGAPSVLVGMGPGSRLVGLGNFTPAGLALGLGHSGADSQKDNASAPSAIGAAGPTVQLRPSLVQRGGPDWQEPAAPYIGHAETPAEPLPRPPGRAPQVAASEIPKDPEATDLLALPAAAAASPTSSGAPSLSPFPLPDRAGDEVGIAEAADLDAGQDLDLLPPAPAGPARASLTQGLAALHRTPAAANTAAPLAFGQSDGLHYRVIQYARFATYLSDTDAEDFGAIYAPDWPTWLAALEIRYRRRRPLVLHLGLLVAESAAPAERGWLLELERYALRRAHTVLVVSEDLRAQVLKHYHLDPSRVRVVAADDADRVRTVLAEISRSA